MLAAREDDLDKIVGLELGCGGSVTEPFNPRTSWWPRLRPCCRRAEIWPRRRRAPAPGGRAALISARREVQVGERALGLSLRSSI